MQLAHWNFLFFHDRPSLMLNSIWNALQMQYDPTPVNHYEWNLTHQSAQLIKISVKDNMTTTHTFHCNPGTYNRKSQLNWFGGVPVKQKPSIWSEQMVVLFCLHHWLFILATRTYIDALRRKVAQQLCWSAFIPLTTFQSHCCNFVAEIYATVIAKRKKKLSWIILQDDNTVSLNCRPIWLAHGNLVEPIQKGQPLLLANLAQLV